MHNHIKLDGLKVFHTAARTLSFKESASELGITPTAVSHRISTLEDQLGTRLFKRGVRHIVLTEAGMRLYEATARAFPILTEAISAIDGSPKSRTATISATTAFASHWIIPRAARFTRSNPGLQLSVRSDNGLADIAAGDADIAVRYGPAPTNAGTSSHSLGSDQFIALCSPLYWDACKAGREPLRRIFYCWERKDRRAPTWDEFDIPAHIAFSHPHDLHLSDEISAFSATLAGQGIALLSNWLARDYLAERSLIQPFEGHLEGFPYHLMTRDRPSPSALALKVWILEELGKE